VEYDMLDTIGPDEVMRRLPGTSAGEAPPDGYGEAFYAAYEEYLEEPRVRAVHDTMLALATNFGPFGRVVDLGCGRGMEFLRYGWPDRYVGIDRNARPTPDLEGNMHACVLAADYRDASLVADVVRDGTLTAAVSLFSVECSADSLTNHAFYENLFRESPIESILSSGFYYTHVRDHEQVHENGWLVSWQTVRPVEDARSEVFDEFRITTPCPSLLFGNDVVEVWRFLTRRPGLVRCDVIE
jgi:hypothetical protein